MLPARALGLPQSIEIDYGEKVETITNFIFLDCKITADGDYSHEINRCSLGKSYEKHSILKSRDITLLTNVHIVKAIIFPVVIYEFDIWSIKKAEHQRIGTFKQCREDS